MAYLAGPRMYYSLFGAQGLFLGARAKLTRRNIEIEVKALNCLHPIHLRVRTTDVELCREILIRQIYECELSRSPRVIIDAGANIGLTSVFYANKYPAATIIALEPESSNYAMLQKNAAPYSNIVTLQAALWDKSSGVDILDPGSGHTAYQVSDTARGLQGAIRSITVDQIMAEFAVNFVDLLKVDIEGAEKRVFEASAEWISRVGVVAVELHDHIQHGSSEAVRAALREFKITWQNGETHYWARIGLAPGSPPRQRRDVDRRFPLRVLG